MYIKYIKMYVFDITKMLNNIYCTDPFETYVQYDKKTHASKMKQIHTMNSIMYTYFEK